MTNSITPIKITVAMSVYGYENFVTDTIESVLNQTIHDFEYIIIDDGCDYNLEDIIKKYNDKRLVYIKNDFNIGLTKSLIRIKEFAQGEYIARIDAGNIACKNRFEKQLLYLENNHEYFLIGSSVMLFDESKEEICKIIANDNPDFIKENLVHHNMLNHSSIMFRNSGNVYYREKFKYSQDYDFYLNLLTSGEKISNIKEVLTWELFSEKSITYDKQEEQRFYENIARKFYLERLTSGKDSYDMFFNQIDNNPQGISGAGPTKREVSNNSDKLFFHKQKIYYLLRSMKLKQARKTIKEAFRKKFNFKLIIYYIMSYLPFIIRFLNNKDKVEFR